MMRTRRRWLALCAAGVTCLGAGAVQAQFVALIEKTKPSILIVGTYKATNSPRFNLRGTGFVVGDGNLAITNAHVLPKPEEPQDGSDLVVQVRREGELQMRAATVLEIDRLRDLALLRFTGEPAPALALGDSDAVKEGQIIAYTGFPIGGALGFSPVTHRGMVSSITPIVLPAANSQRLSARSIRNARDGTFNIFQLDGTAYPGNSGGPVFDLETGQVVAVINMVYVRGTRETALSQPSGITYAIPANFIVPLLQRHPGQPR